MSFLFRTSLVLTAGLMILRPATAQEADEIDWSKDLPAAFAQAKAKQKILLICVNAKYVKGSKREEPAAKGLREVVYRDALVVGKSREFVCVLFTPASELREYGELRALGIEGDIISPQHIFVHPDGDKILLRRQYWSHGKGEAAVKALLAMMDEARAKLAGGVAGPEAELPDVKMDAPTGDERPGWIQKRMHEVREGDRPECHRAIDLLIKNDKDGDCTTPLFAFLTEPKVSTERRVVIIRRLGRDQLLVAALPVAGFLSHKKDELRGNAAVSLEYIGSRDKKVVAALRRAAGREKDEAIANHLYRALGRCGVEDAKSRSLLLKKCTGAKSEFASYGPSIGLGYFEGDEKAARGVEKIVKKIGVPGGRRGGGENTVRRGVICWTLASIGDPQSGKFMREELMARLENMKAFWVGRLLSFYGAVARTCEGREDSMALVEGGVRGFVAFAKRANPSRYETQARSLMDDYRKRREAGRFTPKGDYLLSDSEGP